MLKSGSCLSHLSDLLCASSRRLTALGDGAYLLVDLADGLINLALLTSVLLLRDLALLILLPVLLPGLGGFLLSLGSQDALSLADSPDVRLLLFVGLLGVGVCFF